MTGEKLTRSEQFRLIVACLAVVGCAVAYSPHLTSFLHVKEGVLALFTGILGMLLMFSGRVSRGGTVFLSPLLLLAVVSASEGVCGYIRLDRAAQVELLRWAVLGAFLLSIFDLLERDVARRVLTKTIVGSAVLVALLGIAQYAGLARWMFPDYNGKAHALYSVFGNPGLFGGYLAAALPLAVWGLVKAGPKQIVWSMYTIVLAAGLALSGTRSAWGAALAGILLVVIQGRFWNRRAALAVGILILAVVGVVLVAPNMTLERVQTAVHHADPSIGLRLWFWAGALQMIRDHLPFGAGPGSFAYYSPLALGEVLHHAGGDWFIHNELHTDHAHNDLLELGAEFGIPGLLLLFWWGLRLLRCSGPEWGGLIALLVFSCFYFPFYSAPHALVGLLLAGMLFARHRERIVLADTAGSRAGRWGAIAIGSGALCVAPLVFWMVLLPSFRLRAAEDIHVANGDPVPAYQRALRCDWAPAEVHEKLGLALLQARHAAGAEEEFHRALEGMDTGSVYLGLGVALLQQGKNSEARDAFEACVYRWPSYQEGWELLLRVTPKEGRANVVRRAERWLGPGKLNAKEE